jgi:O-antigen ligase
MIVISIVLPALLAARTVDMMRGLFLCFALALIVNLFFVLDQAPMLLENGRRGYPGYFTFKGVLGECAAFALLLSLHELVYSGWRRMLGVIVIGIAIYLVILSDSNGSLSLALVAPVLAGITLLVGKKTRASVAVVLLPIPLLYAGLDSVVGNLVNRISWYLYGNFTLTGRTIIWDFVSSAIALNPLVGWGYRSFWLVGSDGPSLGAPGWVRAMPSSHNGFMEAKLDLGYVGLTLLVVFIFATLHAIGRVAVRDTPRAWLLLTLALYIILTNFLETGWMHGDDMLWLMFLFVAAEAGRYWQPSFRGAPEPIRRSPRIAARRPSLARAQVSGKLGRF